jgi:hypothetical protein
LVLGEAAGLMFAVNQFSVGLYVKDPAAAPDELDQQLVLSLDRVRQTGGFRLVVSLAAVLDGDFHAFISGFRAWHRDRATSYRMGRRPLRQIGRRHAAGPRWRRRVAGLD